MTHPVDLERDGMLWTEIDDEDVVRDFEWRTAYQGARGPARRVLLSLRTRDGQRADVEFHAGAASELAAALLRRVAADELDRLA